MHRIDTPSAQKDKFGVGKNGFTRGNPQTGTAATKLDNDYFDSIQEEICGVIESAGIALDKTKRTQLAESINKLIGNSKAPAASTTVAGIVQLNSAINSTAENQAATPKAVKTAYDLANTGNTTANTAKSNAATAQTKADSAYTLASAANTTANSAKSTAETDASTTVKGRVQLNSSVNSTVENQAATPKAVKIAYDLAVKATQKAYITDVFKSSDSSSWYRKWSDGFIEQGGYANTKGSVKTINLLIPMNTVQYTVNANNSVPNGNTSNFTSLAQVIGKKTTTQFLLLCGDNSAISYGVEWMVRGY